MVLVGIGLTIAWESLRERHKFKKELEDNAFIDVTGDDWHAAWQTSVENQVVINTEEVCMQQRGKTVKLWNKAKSPENPKGGYLWESQLEFVQGRHLMGWYFPLKSENNSSCGTIFCFYSAPRKIFYGKWVGAGYDGDLATGLLVISKDRNQALGELQRLVELHHEEVNIFATAYESTRTEIELQQITRDGPRLLESKERLEEIDLKAGRKPVERVSGSGKAKKKSHK